MCGIAGIIKIHDPKDGPPPPPLEAIPESWLDILDESIKHRGPDGQGRFRDRAVRDDGTIVDVALVHRRLSIIDHEGGHQPMVHDGERLRPDLTYQPGETPIIASEIEPNKPVVAVVFNGCIYNHRELRTELEAAGHVFETDHSDTEVLVHGWREWKTKLIDQTNAMMAVTHWDRSLGVLALSRDEAGQKPLWTCHPTGEMNLAMFASFAPALWQLKSQITSSFFSDVTTHEITTWIAHGHEGLGCYGLLPLETLLQHETLVFPRWYGGHRSTLWETGGRVTRTERVKRTERITHDKVDGILRDAIANHLTSDVQVAAFLSGGVDSALIAAIAKDIGHCLPCLTVRMPDGTHDESEAASQTASHLGLDHQIIECSPQPAEDIVFLIEHLGLPLGDSSLLPTYWVSKAASSCFKVALAGDGADELFAGYERQIIGQQVERLSHFPFLGKLASLFKYSESDPKSRSAKLARATRAIQHEGYSDLVSIFDTHDQRLLLKGKSRRCISQGCTHVLDYDFRCYLPNDLLRKVDAASMLNALEVRAPFLDHAVVETMRQVRVSSIMPNGQRKGLLKQVARKYLPDHIVDRPKQGFAIPIGEWFRTDYGDMRQLLYDHLESNDPFPGLADAGVEINMKFVNQMLREHDAAGEKSINPWHGRDHSQRLYMLLVLSIWSKWLERVRKEPVAQASRL